MEMGLDMEIKMKDRGACIKGSLKWKIKTDIIETVQSLCIDVGMIKLCAILITLFEVEGS